jgi:hypothetical protein
MSATAYSPVSMSVGGFRPLTGRIPAKMVVRQAEIHTGGDLQLFNLHFSLAADSIAVEETAQRAANSRARWTAEDPDFSFRRARRKASRLTAPQARTR